MVEEWRKIKINKNGIDYDFSDTYKVFSSASEAHRATKIWKIDAVARGERNLAGGYKWQYMDDYLADWWDKEMDKIMS